MSGPWHAVDGQGRDLATGRSPEPPGWPSPAAALAAAPVAPWPVGVSAGDGRRLALGRSVGPGGERVERLLDDLTRGRALDVGDVETLARASPAGSLPLPVVNLGLRAAVEEAGTVDAAWLADVDGRRSSIRHTVGMAGRDAEMEAALHVAVLVATECLDPSDDGDVDAHVASGAQLWLLTGAVVSALSGAAPDPFEPWARLVAAGWWPVGPSGGRLVVTRPKG